MRAPVPLCLNAFSAIISLKGIWIAQEFGKKENRVEQKNEDIDEVPISIQTSFLKLRSRWHKTMKRSGTCNSFL